MSAVQVVHQGYTVTGLVGNMRAEIRENTEGNASVEVTLIDGTRQTPYDLNGLTTLIEDLRQVLALAENVEATNERTRGTEE